MPQFLDKFGDRWSVDLDYGLLKRVQKDVGFDLASAMSGNAEGLSELIFSADPGRLIAILWVICEPNERGVSPEDWARRFNGAAVESASEALLGAIADFFPRSRVARAIVERLPKALAAIDAHAIQTLDTNLDSIFSSWGSESPVSPASKSTDTRSDR